LLFALGDITICTLIACGLGFGLGFGFGFGLGFATDLRSTGKTLPFTVKGNLAGILYFLGSRMINRRELCAVRGRQGEIDHKRSQGHRGAVHAGNLLGDVIPELFREPVDQDPFLSFPIRIPSYFRQQEGLAFDFRQLDCIQEFFVPLFAGVPPVLP
jgi:hypothetical protein